VATTADDDDFFRTEATNILKQKEDARERTQYEPILGRTGKKEKRSLGGVAYLLLCPEIVLVKASLKELCREPVVRVKLYRGTARRSQERLKGEVESCRSYESSIEFGVTGVGFSAGPARRGLRQRRCRLSRGGD
jgi:hypothetical protein